MKDFLYYTVGTPLTVKREGNFLNVSSNDFFATIFPMNGNVTLFKTKADAIKFANDRGLEHRVLPVFKVMLTGASNARPIEVTLSNGGHLSALEANHSLVRVIYGSLDHAPIPRRTVKMEEDVRKAREEAVRGWEEGLYEKIENARGIFAQIRQNLHQRYETLLQKYHRNLSELGAEGTQKAQELMATTALTQKERDSFRIYDASIRREFKDEKFRMQQDHRAAPRQPGWNIAKLDTLLKAGSAQEAQHAQWDEWLRGEMKEKEGSLAFAKRVEVTQKSIIDRDLHQRAALIQEAFAKEKACMNVETQEILSELEKDEEQCEMMLLSLHGRIGAKSQKLREGNKLPLNVDAFRWNLALKSLPYETEIQEVDKVREKYSRFMG